MWPSVPFTRQLAGVRTIMMRLAVVTLLAAACVSSVNGWGAEFACSATATITDDNNEDNKFEVDLGSSTANQQNKVDTPNAAIKDTKMDFELLPGKYSIVVESKGCAGAGTGKPGVTEVVHRGECNGVTVAIDGTVACNMFMMSMEEVTDYKMSAGDDAAQGSAFEPVITSLTIDVSRIKLSSTPTEDRVNATDIVVGIFDMDQRLGHGHHVNWKTDQEVCWDLDGETTNADAPETCDNDFLNKCSTNVAVAGTSDMSYKCTAQLSPDTGSTEDTIFFNVAVQGHDDANQADGEAFTVYGTLAVERDVANEASIMLTHKPAICDGYYEFATCGGLQSGNTSNKKSYARGPSLVVKKGDRYQSPLGIAANPDSVDLLRSGRFEAYNKMRVPVNYDAMPTNVSADNSWKNQFILMEAFVHDEDLGYLNQLDKEEVTLSVKLTSRAYTDQSGRDDPGCGKMFPVTKTQQDRATWDVDGPSPIEKQAWLATTGDVSLTLASKAHGLEVGNVVQQDADDETKKARETRRFQWMWQPFANAPDLNNIAKKDWAKVPTTQGELKDHLGFAQCEFEFTATDATNAMTTGTGFTAKSNQDSNTVKRQFRVGTDPETYAYNGFKEAMPAFLGSLIWDRTPAKGSTTPMQFRFQKQSLCDNVEFNSTTYSVELKTFCTDINTDVEDAYTVKVTIVDGDTAADTIAELRVTGSSDASSYTVERSFPAGGGPDSLKVDFVADATTSGTVTVRLDAYNVNDKDKSTDAQEKRWFTKTYTFTVEEDPTNQNYFMRNPTRRRRTLLSQVERRSMGSSSTALALGGRQRGRRSDKSKSLLAPGNPIRVSLLADGLKKGRVSDGKPTMEIAFEKSTLFAGAAGKAVASPFAVGESKLLEKTAAMCDIIVNATGTSGEQMKGLRLLYQDLLVEQNYADVRTHEKLGAVMKEVLNARNSDKANSDAVVKTLKEQVETVMSGSTEIHMVVQEELKLIAGLNDTTWKTGLAQEEVWAYMINKLERFEEAIALMQYSAQAAVSDQFDEMAKLEKLNSDPSPVGNDVWMETAAGATQITTLALTSVMFLYMLVRFCTPMDRNSESGRFFPLKNQMNF